MAECLLRRSAAFLRACVAFVLLLSAGQVLAQAAKPQKWTTNVVPGEFPSQQAALAAVRALGGAYAYADKVQTVIPTPTTTTYVYEATPRAPVMGEWFGYRGWMNDPYATEADAVAALQAGHYSAPGCPSAVVTPTTGWVASRYWNLSQYVDMESRTYNVKYYYTSSPCQVSDRQYGLSRQRDVYCPAGLVWNNWGGTPDFQTCIKRDIARVSTVPMPCSTCDDLQHNPVSVSTGDKFQSEADFSLPWLTFSRHYHSSHSAPSGKLGPGWTHDLNLRLYVNGSAGSSVLMPRGDILPFAAINGGYEAVDGSGARVYYVGDYRYQLKKHDQIVSFDSAGRAERIDNLNGDALTLGYDAYDRLATVTHSSGRSIVFEYATAPLPANAPIANIKTNGVVLVSYDYDADGRLEYARYPDGVARRYHYENAAYPTHLTGISDENNARYATYGYNSDGYATLSEHAGGEFHGTFNYLADGTTTYTDANGRVQIFSFTSNGAYRKVAQVTDTAGMQSTTYATATADFRRRPLSRVDRRGVQTTYAYSDYTDAVLGDVRQTTTTEAAGTPQSRVTQEWRDRLAGRVLKSAQPGQEVTYQRNARGQVVSVTVNDTTTNPSP